MKAVNFILCLMLFVTNCYAQTTVQGNFSFESENRTYRTYIPAVYTGTESVPLILNLHGYGSNSFEQMLYGSFTAIADTANFIIVHPDGTEDNTGSQFWNSFGLSAPNDVAFLSALIDTMIATYNIDPTRIYSTGMSNGGFMSYTLACELSERITAIASVTGAMVVGQNNTCNAEHPTPAMQIHGTADATVPYNGNSTMMATEDVVQYWVDFNACNSTAEMTSVPNTNTNDNCTAEHYIYTGGNNGATVEFFKVIGGGHSWPGAIFNINTTCMDFNASKEIWRFFSQYQLSALTSTDDITQANADMVRVFPNPSAALVNLVFESDGVKHIRITNAMGQTIENYSHAGSQAVWNAPASGIYFITVQNGSQVQTWKFIKE
jgi:polyhydroxybutyrate depolymerase